MNNNLRNVANSFSSKSKKYDKYAIVQNKQTNKIVDIIVNINRKSKILDLGCGTSFLAKTLVNSLDGINIFGIDLAYSSLEYAKKRQIGSYFPVNANINLIPFANNSFDVVTISSVLQWIDDIPKLLKEVQRVLSPGGSFVFSIFTENTLNDLGLMQKKYGIYVPVYYPKSQDIYQFLLNTNFKNIKTLESIETESFDSAIEQLKSFSAIGSTNTINKRLKREELKLFCKEYEDKYKKNNKIISDYYLLTGSAVLNE